VTRGRRLVLRSQAENRAEKQQQARAFVMRAADPEVVFQQCGPGRRRKAFSEKRAKSGPVPWVPRSQCLVTRGCSRGEGMQGGRPLEDAVGRAIAI